MLLTNYTQNIDNLEEQAGIADERLVQCHGSFKTATCLKCGVRVAGAEIRKEVEEAKVPMCKLCSVGPVSGKRKRKRKHTTKGSKNVRNRAAFEDSDSEWENDESETGIMKVCLLSRS